MMFFKKRKNDPLLKHSMESFDSLIGEGVEIHGRIVVHQSIRIDGTVLGDIEMTSAKKNITIALGESAKVHGDIKGYRILIGGQVEGNIYASERVELHSNAVVNGDITYSDLGIQPGAQVIGLLIRKEGGKSLINDASKVIKNIQSKFNDN